MLTIASDKFVDRIVDPVYKSVYGVLSLDHRHTHHRLDSLPVAFHASPLFGNGDTKWGNCCGDYTLQVHPVTRGRSPL